MKMLYVIVVIDKSTNTTFGIQLPKMKLNIKASIYCPKIFCSKYALLYCGYYPYDCIHVQMPNYVHECVSHYLINKCATLWEWFVSFSLPINTTDSMSK